MTTAPEIAQVPRELLQQDTVTARDERTFFARLAAVALFLALGGWLALQPSVPLAAIGIVILGLVFTHMVELQHQCLHHSAFRSAKPHRYVGVALGAPMLVGYTHYRIRHLQHHKALGTPDDTEFFGFDTRQRLTTATLLRGCFDLPRLLAVARAMVRSWAGRWQPEDGLPMPDRHKMKIMVEYRLLSVLLVGLIVLSVAGGGEAVMRLWVLPLLVAMPVHFLVELPEHILCDTSTTNILFNTRSITGSTLSRWYTNGNNLHVEHHAAMRVPLQRLDSRHGLVRQHGKYVSDSYASFYIGLGRHLLGNRGTS